VVASNCDADGWHLAIPAIPEDLIEGG